MRAAIEAEIPLIVLAANGRNRIDDAASIEIAHPTGTERG